MFPIRPKPSVSPTRASGNAETESKVPSTKESKAPRENKTGDNENPTKNDTGSTSNRNSDPMVGHADDITAPASGALNGKETIENARPHGILPKGPPEKNETGAEKSSALETEMAYVSIKGSTVIDTGIPSCEDLNVPIEKVVNQCDELSNDPLKEQGVIPLENTETGTEAPSTSGSKLSLKTEKAMTPETIRTDLPKETDAFIAQSEKVDIPCNEEATKNYTDTVLSECDSTYQLNIFRDDKAVAIADLGLLTQYDSVNEPDGLSEDDGLFTSADMISAKCSIGGDVSMGNEDKPLGAQYKSGDEDIMTSDDDLLSIQFSCNNDEVMRNADDIVTANRDNMDSPEDVLYTQFDEERCDELDDEKTLTNANQTETFTFKNGKQSDVPCENEAMEIEDLNPPSNDCAVLEQQHVSCNRKGSRAPFLQRNRKRTLNRVFDLNVSSVQSTFILKQDNSVAQKIGVCAPKLNVPSKKKSASIHQHELYRVHVLLKETNGRVTTTITSFCLKAYQCHLCSVNCTDMEHIWQHCSSIHGDQYRFYPIETTDGVFHLLVEQKNPSQRDTNDENVVNESSGNQPSLSVAEEPQRFKDVFRANVSLPMRQYYHDVTFHPIGLSEWLFNLIDIDYDPEWRSVADTSALFDMTDISTSEKIFMTLWNNFMRSHPILSEIQLSSQLISFVKEHSNAILKCDLHKELSAHVVNMWVEGHIGRGTVVEAMKIYNLHADQRV